MKKALAFLVAVTLAAMVAGAAEPLWQELPPQYTAFCQAVYQTTAQQEQLDALYKAAQQEAAQYAEPDKQTLLALCDYLRGMDRYFWGDTKAAARWFDSADTLMRAALAQQKTAFAYACWTRILMQNAAVKGLGYQLSWVPKLPDMIGEAIALDESCFEAQFMRQFFNCSVPSPYGDGYAKGADGMTRLLEATPSPTPVQEFSMLCAIGYALAKKNKKAEARSYYERALQLFPTNRDALQYLQALQK